METYFLVLTKKHIRKSKNDLRIFYQRRNQYERKVEENIGTIKGTFEKNLTKV